MPCVLSFTAGASNLDGVVVERSYELHDCRRWYALRPPRCTPAEIWERAKAQGAPAEAAARLHLGARYRSSYDPVDPSDEADRPERGIWRLEIERVTGKDFRVETPDDCGQPPPSAAEGAVMGLFQGDLDGIRARWAACADAIAPRISLPASLPEVRLVLRVEAGGTLTLSPPPFD